MPARLAGGLAPQLLLAELQRLQRRRLVGGGASTARRSLQAPLQQANRSSAVPGCMPVQACQPLQQAKEAVAAAGARPLAPQCVTQGTSGAEAEQAAPSSSKPAAAPGSSAMGGQRPAAPSKQRPPVPPTKPAPLDLAALDPAVDPAEQPLPNLSDNQMDALCDALLREMLLEECAPCARPPPFPPL